MIECQLRIWLLVIKCKWVWFFCVVFLESWRFVLENSWFALKGEHLNFSIYAVFYAISIDCFWMYCVMVGVFFFFLDQYSRGFVLRFACSTSSICCSTGLRIPIDNLKWQHKQSFYLKFCWKKTRTNYQLFIQEINSTMTNRQILTILFFVGLLRNRALRPLATNYLNQYVEQIIRARRWIDHEEFLRAISLSWMELDFDESEGEKERTTFQIRLSIWAQPYWHLGKITALN